MAKQTINIGTTANDKKGDSLRAAFQKVNANFTELYTALGLNSDGTLNLGAFEFVGSTMSTTDSTAITIDQAVTVTSDLTVGGDILPSVANGGNLGSLAKPFKSLYVSESTVYFGGVPLSLDSNNELRINNVPLSQTANVPADVSDLTDTTGLLGGDTGDITFAATTISAPNEDEIVIQSKDINGFGTARVTLNSEFGGDARLRAFSSESVDTFTLANGDFATGVWRDNGFGNGVVEFTVAQGIGDFFQNTLFKLTPDNVTISINGGTPFVWNGGTNGAGTDTPGFGTNPIVPATPITITSIEFRYRSESFISVNYDNQEIRLNVQNGGITFDANNTIQMFGDSNIELQSGSDFSISSGQNINISTASSDSISLSTGDLNFTAFDDVNFRGSDSFRLRNTSATAPIRIITDDNNTQKTWAFNPNGSLTFPDATIQSTAFTGEADTLDSVTDRGAITTNNITVGSVITTDITNKLSAATGNIVSSVRFWDSAGANLYVWFDAASTPELVTLGNFGSINGWTVSLSGGNSATITATNPAGYFSISTDVALTGSGTLTFASPDYAPPAPLPIDINVGANTWTFDNSGDLTFPDGTTQTTAFTGSVATGDITFDGVKIQGAGTASGDGNGYSTLELVPDTSLYVNNQYLVIDPTEPQHIHIRAGGTQDASTASLFLGGEKNNVRVIDGTGVRLYNEVRNDTFSSFSDPTNFNTATWYGTPGNYFVEFTEVTAGMGNLAFTFGNDAENRVTVFYGAGESSVLTYGGSSANLGGGVYRFAVVEAPPASPTVLTAIEFQIWTTNENSLELQNNDLTVSVEDDIRITGNDIFSLRNRSTTEGIEIRTDYDNADRVWEFTANGTLNTPGDIVVVGDITGTAGASTLVLRAQPSSNTAIQLNNIVDSEIRTVANLVIRTDVSNTPDVWTFGTDGGLTFPDATVQSTAFTGNAATVDITNTNGIDTNYSITFVENRDGAEILRADVDLTFNSWSNTLTTGNVAIKQTLTGGVNDGSDFIITTVENPNRNNASNIGIYPGLASGTASEAGFVSIVGGGSDVVGLAGGDVYLRGGAHSNGGTNGTVRVESILKIDDGVHEKFQTKTSATGTVVHDCSLGHIFYHTLPSSNWTVNLTNLNLAVGYATTVTIVIEQGATGYYPNALQIAGNAQPFVWQGNTTPTPSTNRIDVVTFSILYDGLYTVLGQLTGF